MTSTVPGIIAWPVITLMAILLSARFRWCRANLYDTYYNNLMAFVLLAQLLRERKVEGLLSKSALMTVTTAQQLAFAAMIFASTEFVGFTMLWTRHSPVETRRDHGYYRLAAVILCVAYLVAATRARVAGQTLEVSGGWDAIWAWSFYLTMIFVVGARVSWMFAVELRKTTRNREFLLAVGGLLLGVVAAAGCSEALVLAVTDQLGWTSTIEFRLWFHGFEFFSIAVIVFTLGAVPLAAKLLSYFGMDRTGRTWNRLKPLRLSLTAVVPECSFNLEQDDHRFQKTPLELHQTVIEIRDVILRLRPYLREIASHELAGFLKAYSVPTREHDAATHALQLANAAKAKAAGVTPEPPDMALILRSRSTTLDEEVAELLKLAKWWPVAYATTDRFTLSAPEVTAQPR